MGCVSSRPDINDHHPEIFQVVNVDQQGRMISPGKLEVTETELVLHHTGKPPTVWPLRCLRKYGFDSEHFSFECGRRCPTGHGFYGFKCRKAEQLFNTVNHFININDNNRFTGNEFPIPVMSTGPAVQRRTPSHPQTEAYLTPLPTTNNMRPHSTLSRPGSISSNGPMSPPISAPPPADVLLEHNNNNKRGSLIPEHSYTNTSALVDSESVQPIYANCGSVQSSILTNISENYVNLPSEIMCHEYMNVDTKDISPKTNTKENEVENLLAAEPEEDVTHCYANINTKESDHLRPQTSSNIYLVRKVNYAKLVFNPITDNGTIPQNPPPDSPNKTKESYAMIDFHRTEALSQSTNPRLDNEEGIRKTRHNSSISEVTSRIRSSLSD